MEKGGSGAAFFYGDDNAFNFVFRNVGLIIAMVGAAFTLGMVPGTFLPFLDEASIINHIVYERFGLILVVGAILLPPFYSRKKLALLLVFSLYFCILPLTFPLKKDLAIGFYA